MIASPCACWRECCRYSNPNPDLGLVPWSRVGLGLRYANPNDVVTLGLRLGYARLRCPFPGSRSTLPGRHWSSRTVLVLTGF